MLSLFWNRDKTLQGELTRTGGTVGLMGAVLEFAIGTDYLGEAIQVIDNANIAKTTNTDDLLVFTLTVSGAAISAALEAETKAALVWQLTAIAEGVTIVHQGVLPLLPAF